MIDEQYIEHEVKLRLNDELYKIMRTDFNRLNNKLNFIIATGITSILIPLILHHYQMI